MQNANSIEQAVVQPETVSDQNRVLFVASQPLRIRQTQQFVVSPLLELVTRCKARAFLRPVKAELN